MRAGLLYAVSWAIDRLARVRRILFSIDGASTLIFPLDSLLGDSISIISRT